MNRIDSEFTENLENFRALLLQIKKLADYDTNPDLPPDIDSPCCLQCVESIEVWGITLDKKVSRLSELVEKMQVVGHVRERFREIENELLPCEGNPGHLVGQ